MIRSQTALDESASRGHPHEQMPAPPAELKESARFPLAAGLLALLVGSVYFIPEGLYWLRWHQASVLFEENPEETSFAVLASRAAGEHPGQPDPYQPDFKERPASSSFAVQSFPPAALALLARATGASVNAVFWAGSFFFPAIIALLFACIAWLAGLRNVSMLYLLGAVALLALPPPYWHIWARQIAKIVAGRPTDFRILLPYARRFQPQFTAVVHYAAIAASLLILHCRATWKSWAAGAAAGVFFGISFYCYFFSWSVLLGWFVLGGAAVFLWHRRHLKQWIFAFVAGILIATPYLLSVAEHFHAVAASGGVATSRQITQVPDLLAIFGACALLLLLLRSEKKYPALLWVPAVLSLSPALGVLQNAITGLYIQPFHYIHYFARPALGFAFVALAACGLDRLGFSLQNAPLRAALWAVALSLMCSSVLVQWRHYREAGVKAGSVFTALPALDFLKGAAAAGSVAYSPVPEVEEAIPLYTSSVPYFSQHMWSHETPSNRDLILRRLAGTHVLDGMRDAEFAALARSRPWIMYYNYLVAPGTEGRMSRIEASLLEDFQSIQSGGGDAFQDLRYVVLPAATELQSTAIPHFFTARNIWHDGSYTIFELSPRGSHDAP